MRQLLSTDEAVIEKWRVSYFERPKAPPLTPALRKRAEAEYRADPLGCLRQNVTEAQRDLRECTGRFFEAEQDGLFEFSRFKALETDRDRSGWLLATDTVRGDFARATGELAHWRRQLNPLPADDDSHPAGQEYRDAAQKRRVSAPGGYTNGVDLVRMLADMKSGGLEDDTEELRREAQDKLARWSEDNR